MANDPRVIITADGYDGHQPTLVCPHCHKRKPLSEFGFRKMNNGKGPVRNQPWCRECRKKG